MKKENRRYTKLLYSGGWLLVVHARAIAGNIT